MDYWHHWEHHNNPEYVLYTRRFIQAVLKYTGAKRVNVVVHSLGNTIVRKAIKGGWINNTIEDDVYVGKPLTHHINTFIGIAGMNWGWVNC